MPAEIPLTLPNDCLTVFVDDTATKKFATAPSKTWVEVRAEGVIFWFDAKNAAWFFALHCRLKGIQYRREI
jgi:hypothetical protein